MDPMTTTLSGTCLPKNAPQYSFARPHGTLLHWTFGSWFSKKKESKKQKNPSEFSLKCLLFLCHCVSSFSWILLIFHCQNRFPNVLGGWKGEAGQGRSSSPTSVMLMISGKKTDPAQWPKGLLVCWILSQQNISMPTLPRFKRPTGREFGGQPFFWTEK